MFCPNCSGSISVLDTLNSETEIYRHRKCQDCGFKFYTIESAVPSERVAPLFTEWQKERSRKHRAKKRGLVYEPAVTGNTKAVPKKPTSPLF